VEKIVLCTQPDFEAPVCDTTPIVQMDVVDDDLSISEDVVVEVKIAHSVVTEEDDVEAFTQAPSHKVFLVPSVMRFCVPLLVLVLVYINFFYIFDFALVGNVSVRVVTGCTFIRLITGIQVSLSSWRDIGRGQKSIEV